MLQIFNIKVKIFVFISLWLAFSSVFTQALASSSSALYDVEVLVADESAGTRWRVFKEGLDEVFIRISGDSIVMDKLKRPPASRYIKQYSYDPVENPVVNDNDEILAHRLKIQYNGSTMAKYLRDNGFSVWGEHRPDVVIWLVIRDGKNEYVLKDNDQSLLKTTADDALRRRGISERWPLYDAKDRKILKVADIRGGFRDPVVAASKRYGRGPSLTGSLIWNGRQWQGSWSLLMANANRHWSIVDADYNRLINKAIDQVADAMGAVFAIHGVDKNQQLIAVQLQVQAVNSIQKYHRLENYLRDLSAVVQVEPLNIDGQNAVFKVTLRSDEDAFLNLIKNDAELIEVAPVKPKPTLKKEVPENKTQPLPENNSTTVPNVSAGSEKIAETVDAKNAKSGGELKQPLPTVEPASEVGSQLGGKPDDQLDKKPPSMPIYYYRLNR